MQSGAYNTVFRLKGSVGPIYFGSSSQVSERYVQIFAKLAFVAAAQRTISSRTEYLWSTVTGGGSDPIAGLIYLSATDSSALMNALRATSKQVAGPILR